MLATATLGLAAAYSTVIRKRKILDEKPLDERERGAPYERSKTVNRARIGLNIISNPIQRPPPYHQKSVLMRQPITEEGNRRMQHIYFLTQQEAPDFFNPKSQRLDRQLQYNTVPFMHPGYTRIERTHFQVKPMPVAPPHVFA
jgi:hypothetical protein